MREIWTEVWQTWPEFFLGLQEPPLFLCFKVGLDGVSFKIRKGCLKGTFIDPLKDPLKEPR